jgi:uncharacterized phage-associated protein
VAIYPAIEVARWILHEAASQKIVLSHMQLQKILYYAQGYNLGMSGEKLFEDPIMAWEHGPVVPTVYRHYRHYGNQKIFSPDHVTIPDDIQEFIRLIVSEKGNLSASALRRATHEEMPYSTTPRNEEISSQKLEEFFVDMFWASDEEDAYEPAFCSEEEEQEFFRNSLTAEEKKVLIDACSIEG